jgi:hypothetical protein
MNFGVIGYEEDVRIPLADSYEHGDELLCYTEGGNFLTCKETVSSSTGTLLRLWGNEKCITNFDHQISKCENSLETVW